MWGETMLVDVILPILAILSAIGLLGIGLWRLAEYILIADLGKDDPIPQWRMRSISERRRDLARRRQQFEERIRKLTTQSEILTSIKHVNRLCLDGKFDQLNQELTDWNFEAKPFEVSLAVARTSFPARKYLSYYESFLYRLKSHLETQGRDDVDKLLQGLLYKDA